MDITQDQLQAYAARDPHLVYHLTLDEADLETRCPLDNGRHSIRPRESLGQLDVLPFELLSDILLTLDLPTLTVFRRVNFQAMHVVNSLHQYKMISKHCINVLRAAVSLEAASFDCRTLYETLRTRKCGNCHRFGSYLYLITCKRVCYFCFSSTLKFRPMSAKDAARFSGLPMQDLMHLPHVMSLAGRYSWFGKIPPRRRDLLMPKRRTLLFDAQAVLDTVSGGWSDESQKRIWNLDPMTREPTRYMSIITAPYFNSSGCLSYWGFYCTKCRGHKGAVDRSRNKYTEDEFLGHIGQHEAANINQRLIDG
ncbi:hypothetical protein F5Y13DRAFT_21962 [Hypoxylon sp. FL1857]|nr:hypothetical protein F5Y13DRAFT_21962 [Hypoxylon sp. FL1857]